MYLFARFGRRRQWRLPTLGVPAQAALSLIGAGTLAVTLAACGSASPAAMKTTGVTSPPAEKDIAELTWAVNTEPASLDPILTYNFYDDQIVDNMCESLFRLNPDLTVSPLLATAALHPNPTTWVYVIRRGVRFWDGHPLTAADVVYSLRRNLDPELGSLFSTYYARVKDIRQTGPYQVTVDLTQPDALWNQVLVVSGSAIVDKAWAVKQPKTIGTPSVGLMCTGPYEFGSWKRGTSITLVRNPQYWNVASRARAAKVVFSFLTDPSAQTQALISGSVDGMFLTDPSGLPRLASSSGHLYLGKNLFTNYLIPTRLRSPLNNVDVRRALALVIDRPGIADTIYYGAAQPMRTMDTPTAWGNDPAVRQIYEHVWNQFASYASPHVAMARQLFQKAGAPKKPITLAFPTGGAEQQIAEAVQSSARQIGMNIELKGYTLAALQNIYYDPKAQVAAGIDLLYTPFDLDATDPLDMYTIFIPSVQSIYNYSGYSNPEVTQLLTRAWSTYDNVQRASLIAAAERIMMGDLPMIPLVSPDVIAYMNNRATGAPTSFSVYWSAWANRVGAP